MWGIVPAAGMGARIQPLAFSKELLPIGTRPAGASERPCAVAEYLVERMAAAGADRICFVIGAAKVDIMRYFGASREGAQFCYRVQPEPRGLCDAIFQALPLVPPQETVLVGLPDTIWYPDDGLRRLPEGLLALLLFPVARPERFDAVITDEDGAVREVQVKRADATSRWVWGAFKAPSRAMHELFELWTARGRTDVYFGTLLNAYLAAGGRALGCRFGEEYVDVGTPEGYREALRVVEARRAGAPAAQVHEA